MNLKITKQKHYKEILDKQIKEAPNGVYAGELKKEFGDYDKVKEVIHYLKSRGAVTLDYSVTRDNNIDSSLMYLIYPESSKLIEIKNETFLKIFFKDLFSPANLIAFLALIVSIISLIISFSSKP